MNVYIAIYKKIVNWKGTHYNSNTSIANLTSDLLINNNCCNCSPNICNYKCDITKHLNTTEAICIINMLLEKRFWKSISTLSIAMQWYHMCHVNVIKVTCVHQLCRLITRIKHNTAAPKHKFWPKSPAAKCLLLLELENNLLSMQPSQRMVTTTQMHT